MSALKSRDPMNSARAQPQGGAWLWPDPQEVTAPAVRAGRPVRGGQLPGNAQWPSDPPGPFWPPGADGERAAPRPVRAVESPAPAVFEEYDALSLPEPPIRGSFGFQASPGYDAAPGQALHAPMPGATAAALGAAQAGWADPVPAGPAPSPGFDPSPSRLAYRLNRLWLTPFVRNFLRLGLPLLMVAAFAGGWLSKPENREMVTGQVAAAVDWVQNQPMFTVTGIEVEARSPEVALGVEQLMGLSFPLSSWDLDLTDLRARAESLDAVERAWLQIRSGGVLEVRIAERVPAMIWRNGDVLDLVDGEGHRVARLATRAARADLPLIAGAGAPEAIAEAQALWTAAAPIQGRIRGLVRVGERRWDVVLDRNQRILLPETGALEALERVVAMSEGAQQLLSRDVTIVDMRQAVRPTLRLTAEAMTELTRNRTETRGAPRR
ncbi:cell division protein FtsQ/DivIB [Pararhodobacter sp.]|uniref:cell division protein FtsQ/DivIB n=1 Tax=Pararhodobacter sp. TaxID=2127056 RepID=UPI002FE3EFCB